MTHYVFHYNTCTIWMFPVHRVLVVDNFCVEYFVIFMYAVVSAVKTVQKGGDLIFLQMYVLGKESLYPNYRILTHLENANESSDLVYK